MEEALKQILTKLDNIEKDISGLKQGQKTLEDGQSLLLKMHFEQEDKMDSRFKELDKKLDKIYNNTVGIAKNFTDTEQEVTMVKYRQGKHSKELEDHEDRITKLEEKIA